MGMVKEAVRLEALGVDHLEATTVEDAELLAKIQARGWAALHGLASFQALGRRVCESAATGRLGSKGRDRNELQPWIIPHYVDATGDCGSGSLLRPHAHEAIAASPSTLPHCSG